MDYLCCFTFHTECRKSGMINDIRRKVCMTERNRTWWCKKKIKIKLQCLTLCTIRFLNNPRKDRGKKNSRFIDRISSLPLLYWQSHCNKDELMNVRNNMMEISQQLPYGWFQFVFCLRTDLQLYHIRISFNRAIWLWKSNKYIRTIKKMVDALFKKTNGRHF